ncbi:hypothetical protein [Streptomyces sp. CC228A]|uniref:hypothetical protein n=1 Tax=Streptomyces sp. CC228A TaxID=2898186 RepID=UPI001F3B7736|nr:hypothetical protein [Streptomyces sp. CC228A]
MRKALGVTLAVLALLGATQAPVAAAAPPAGTSAGSPSAPAHADEYYAYPYVRCDGGYVAFGYEGTWEHTRDWYGLYHRHADPGLENGYYHGMATWKDSWGFTHWAWQWATTAKERQTGIRSGDFKVIYWTPHETAPGHYTVAGSGSGRVHCS